MLLGGKGLKKVLIQQPDTEPSKTHRLLDAKREYWSLDHYIQ
jgi:hypothetical protein